jgi:hypothetical protein
MQMFGYGSTIDPATKSAAIVGSVLFRQTENGWSTE